MRRSPHLCTRTAQDWSASASCPGAPSSMRAIPWSWTALCSKRNKVATPFHANRMERRRHDAPCAGARTFALEPHRTGRPARLARARRLPPLMHRASAPVHSSSKCQEPERSDFLTKATVYYIQKPAETFCSEKVTCFCTRFSSQDTESTELCRKSTELYGTLTWPALPLVINSTGLFCHNNQLKRPLP